MNLTLLQRCIKRPIKKEPKLLTLKNKNMKSLKLVTLLLFITSFSMNAQQNPEKMAKKIADEVTEVLSLNQEESDAVYQIQLNRFKETVSIKKEFKDDPEARKAAMKKNGDNTSKQMKQLLGNERMKIWVQHKDSK